MMRAAAGAALVVLLGFSHAGAQTNPATQTTLRVQSTLVQVPVLVKTKKGEPVFALTAGDFRVADDGVEQRVKLEEDTDSQPLALAVVVETGGAGARHLQDYRRLDAILDALIGNVKHRVALIGFDSVPHSLVPFTPHVTPVSEALANLPGGDAGAAILDAVAYAVGELRQQPEEYRRAVLLLSETIDQGSQTRLTDALRLISDTNTTMYTFAFSSTRSAVAHEGSKFNSDEPGPAHGCFSRQGADEEYKGHYSRQVLDCVSQLAPPLRLATMAFLAARDGLKKNTSESIAQLTGGEYFHFRNAKDLSAALIGASNDVPNFYVLSFTPTDPAPGLHTLHVELRDRPQLRVQARTEYWVDEAAK